MTRRNKLGSSFIQTVDKFALETGVGSERRELEMHCVISLSILAFRLDLPILSPADRRRTIHAFLKSKYCMRDGNRLVGLSLDFYTSPIFVEVSKTTFLFLDDGGPFHPFSTVTADVHSLGKCIH